jgi:hypothetical protein
VDSTIVIISCDSEEFFPRVGRGVLDNVLPTVIPGSRGFTLGDSYHCIVGKRDPRIPIGIVRDFKTTPRLFGRIGLFGA